MGQRRPAALLLPRTKGQAEGAIAQLGERRVCNAKVVGSIPTGSTTPTIRSQRVMSHARIAHALRKGRMTHGMRVMRLVCVL